MGEREGNQVSRRETKREKEYTEVETEVLE